VTAHVRHISGSDQFEESNRRHEDPECEPGDHRDHEASGLPALALSSVGRFKAPFFAALGYSQEQWPQLEADLRALLALHDAQPAAVSSYGQKYEIRAILIGPNGRSAEVVSIWIILASEDAPRLVTAYPGGTP